MKSSGRYQRQAADAALSLPVCSCHPCSSGRTAVH